MKNGPGVEALRRHLEAQSIEEFCQPVDSKQLEQQTLEIQTRHLEQTQQQIAYLQKKNGDDTLEAQRRQRQTRLIHQHQQVRLNQPATPQLTQFLHYQKGGITMAIAQDQVADQQQMSRTGTPATVYAQRIPSQPPVPFLSPKTPNSSKLLCNWLSTSTPIYQHLECSTPPHHTSPSSLLPLIQNRFRVHQAEASSQLHEQLTSSQQYSQYHQVQQAQRQYQFHQPQNSQQ